MLCVHARLCLVSWLRLSLSQLCVWAGAVLGDGPACSWGHPMLLWHFPLEQKIVTCWPGLEQWHPSTPGLRLSSFLCQLWMSRCWQWLGNRSVVTVAGVQQSCWGTLAVLGVRLTEGGLVTVSNSGMGCRGQVLWECCSASVLGCSSAPGMELWCHHLPQLMLLPGLQWSRAEKVLQCFHPWGSNFLSVTLKSVKWGFFIPNKVLLFWTSKLQWDMVSLVKPWDQAGVWRWGWRGFENSLGSLADLWRIQQSLPQMISVTWSSGFSLWFQ